MTLHAFTVVDNSIACKFFVGDENTVQKFEGELLQLVIFSFFVYIIYTFFSNCLQSLSFFSDHVFFLAVGNLFFFSRNNW